MCSDVSHELLDKARGASKALEACLATLSDGADNDVVREALGMDANTLQSDHRMGDDAAASAALQKVYCSHVLGGMQVHIKMVCHLSEQENWGSASHTVRVLLEPAQPTDSDSVHRESC